MDERPAPPQARPLKTIALYDGTALPAVGLGTWKPQGEDVCRAVCTALEAGYRHLDCAAIYGNEDVIGRALADACAAGEVHREDVWVTSKLWNTEHAPARVRPALDATLAALKLEYVDLYLMHWSVALRPGAIVRSPPCQGEVRQIRVRIYCRGRGAWTRLGEWPAA